ncbi:CDP-glucose 4,6-dehydratase [Bacillus cereus]|uniref:CDP-glucose 4,6-dehydratase n=1 Tax=Bacillus TaxID=1386 RepID=UPI000555C832|nr:CDP-glucose 4,6-dehydratase [Bacillus sp. UNC322MFChir4.1]
MLSNGFNNVFHEKKVLITGHTGFKGSWLSIWLKELGATVIGYSLDPKSKKDNFILTNLQNDIIDIRGDIRDFNKLNKVFEEHKPEIVFHLAAQPLVKYSYDFPKETYDINVMGTMNILEAIRLHESTKVGIIVTSDKCYENSEWVWGYRENDPMGGYDLYSSSKGCCELLISSYRNSYFPEKNYDQHEKIVASVRAGNVIGGGDWSVDRIIPDCIRALESNHEIAIRNPNAIRPWQHVLEPLSGYLLLTEKILTEGVRFSGAWNFGPTLNNMVPVKKLVTSIVKIWGHGDWVLPNEKQDEFHEATFLNLDISKAKFKLNWEPKWSLQQTLKHTVDWYKSYHTHSCTRLRNLCVSQIKQYCQS